MYVFRKTSEELPEGRSIMGCENTRVKNNPAMPWLPFLQLSQPKFSPNEITNNSYGPLVSFTAQFICPHVLLVTFQTLWGF